VAPVMGPRRGSNWRRIGGWNGGVTLYGEKIGLAFRLPTTFLMTATTAELGKIAEGCRCREGDLHLYGIEEARRLAQTKDAIADPPWRTRLRIERDCRSLYCRPSILGRGRDRSATLRRLPLHPSPWRSSVLVIRWPRQNRAAKVGTSPDCPDLVQIP
jgi:hypothetical protein